MMETFFRRKFSHVKHIFVRQSTLSYDYVKDIFQYFSMFFIFSKKSKLNFLINFSDLRAVMYSLMIHTMRLLFFKRTSMKDSCWIVYFRSCIVHWCWNAFNVDSTWNSQRYFNFIPQILYFLDSRVILIWQITYLTYQLYH